MMHEDYRARIFVMEKMYKSVLHGKVGDYAMHRLYAINANHIAGPEGFVYNRALDMFEHYNNKLCSLGELREVIDDYKLDVKK